MRFYTQQHSHYCGIDLHARLAGATPFSPPWMMRTCGTPSDTSSEILCVREWLNGLRIIYGRVRQLTADFATIVCYLRPFRLPVLSRIGPNGCRSTTLKKRKNSFKSTHENWATLGNSRISSGIGGTDGSNASPEESGKTQQAGRKIGK